ncbi:hypothetical protein [Massilia sp. NR 4-1]|uniref:hypothetical protein n=1 Tax=Massilia sp. NR 4-1 TaxID=1678028 RepID=UPI00067D47D2|nr:hypothetical protein [Massilia sp. NR 4-1]AKU23732.1 hypothetical protein ACZ75_22030 [Massilia sp. NR 4-1]
MSIMQKLWDGICTHFRISDRVDRLNETVKAQQCKLEAMNDRLIRLETALEFSLAAGKPFTLNNGRRDWPPD